MKTIVSLICTATGNTWKENLEDVLLGFGNKYLRFTSENIKRLFREWKNDEAFQVIQGVPMFCVSGYFDQTVDKKFGNCYSGLILLEIKGINSEKATEIEKKIESIPCTYAWFPHLYEPTTILILARVDSGVSNRKVAYRQVSMYYSQMLDLRINRNPNYADEWCYCAFKPKIFINPGCLQFNVVLDVPSHNIPSKIS